jgi:hypothetical protein
MSEPDRTDLMEAIIGLREVYERGFANMNRWFDKWDEKWSRWAPATTERPDDPSS